jgi:hypothetical protein
MLLSMARTLNMKLEAGRLYRFALGIETRPAHR